MSPKLYKIVQHSTKRLAMMSQKRNIKMT